MKQQKTITTRHSETKMVNGKPVEFEIVTIYKLRIPLTTVDAAIGITEGPLYYKVGFARGNTLYLPDLGYLLGLNPSPIMNPIYYPYSLYLTRHKK
jgi:hypothetical protein